jgi:hypothetical protein
MIGYIEFRKSDACLLSAGNRNSVYEGLRGGNKMTANGLRGHQPTFCTTCL